MRILQILHIDPRQEKLLRTIKIPTKKVTSVTFGGEFLDILYVTTATNQEEKTNNPYSGCVFAIKNLGIHGLAPNKFKLEQIE
jgi:L-arabinonolactonase